MDSQNYFELEVPVTRSFIRTVSDLSYSQVADAGVINRDLMMNILIPDTDKPLPLVIFVPGGRFLYVNNDSNIQNRLRIAEKGYVVASIEYRLAPNNTFPAPVIDVKSAIRYLKAHAGKYNIDANRIAVYGESAGGYMAAFAGTTTGLNLYNEGSYCEFSSDVHAVIDLFGVTNLATIGAEFSADQQRWHHEAASPECLFLYGADPEHNQGLNSDPQKLAASNPMHYISAKTPPFLIMHGGSDTIMSVTESRQLHEALLRNGTSSHFYFIRNAQHSGVVWQQDQIISIILSFLEQVLK